MRSLVRMTLAIAMILPLAACGNTPGKRALTGGAIGAGTGAVGAALLNANPVAGAVIGGAAGAVTGAVTDKRQINLGN